MAILDNIMSRIGFKQQVDNAAVCGGEVEIKDGKIIGNPYAEFDMISTPLTPSMIDLTYSRVACVGTSIDLISNNIQMIEPVFWNDDLREMIDYKSDKFLKRVMQLFRKPNVFDTRKTFLSKCVKNYCLHGAIFFGFQLDTNKRDVISIKILDNANVSIFDDIVNNRIGSFEVNNSGAFTGTYTFNGSTYYANNSDSFKFIAPLINPRPDIQYLPASILEGVGVEVLMYWYGCYHNKSLLQNGARPSLVFMIKSLLNPKAREQLKSEIKMKHSGAGNAGNVIVMDGAADKDVKQLSQNNKDMEFNETLKAAEDAIYKRLGTNWVLDKKVNTKDLDKGMEMLFDLTICPLFQNIYNYLFSACKYFALKTGNYDDYSIFYLEQDIPALRPRFLQMMKDLPNLQIFTVAERRAMYNFKPLGDERDDELVVQTVRVTQTGNNGENTTGFSGENN